MVERGNIRQVRTKVPEKIWQEAVRLGIDKILDVWFTGVLVEEIERRKGEEASYASRRSQ